MAETPSAGTVCALGLEGVAVGLINPAADDGYAERRLAFRPFNPDVQFKSSLLFRPDAQKASPPPPAGGAGHLFSATS